MKALPALWAIAFGLSQPPIAAKCDLDAGISAEQGRAGLCGFSPSLRTFRGTPAEQARCLTRAVGPGATIGAPAITPYLRDRAGRATAITRQSLSDYLTRLGIDPVLRLGGAAGDPVTADYFILHDTSMPNCSEEEWSRTLCPARGVMPPGRDGAGWAALAGFFGHPKPFPDRLAHAWTNRVGDSITEAGFDLPLASTKFETCFEAAAKQGLFVAVENIQPRIGQPAVPAAGKRANDRVAPVPGFPAAQYERLALLYVAASVRRGRWLIPAFHAVLDSRFADGHDDPQNFDMQAFSDAVRRHVERLSAR